MVVFAVAAVDDVEERRLDAFGHGAAGSGADHAPVELADRGDLRGGAGEEGFVADVDVVGVGGTFSTCPGPRRWTAPSAVMPSTPW